MKIGSLFFKKFVYLRELKAIPFIGSFSSCSSQLVPKRVGGNTIWISHVGGRKSITCSFTVASQVCISRKLELGAAVSWIQKLNPCALMWDMDFTTRPNALTLGGSVVKPIEHKVE